MFRTPSLGDDSYDFLPSKPEGCAFISNFGEDDLFDAKLSSRDLPNISTNDLSEFLEFRNDDARTQTLNVNFTQNNLSAHVQTQNSQNQIQRQFVNQNNAANQEYYNQKYKLNYNRSPILSQIMSAQRDSILDTLESIAPKFPPQDMDLPDISVTNGLQTTPMSNRGMSASHIFTSTPMATNQSTLVSSGTAVAMTVSPTNSSTSNVSNVTPPLESSEDSDDSVPLAQVRLFPFFCHFLFKC